MCLIVTLTLLLPTCLCVSLLRWPFYFQHAYVSHCYVDPFISNMPMCLIVTLTLLFLTCLCVSLLRWPFYFQHAYVSHCYVDPFISNMPMCLIGGSCHKYHFCCNRSIYMYACCDKPFVVTKLCLLWQNFCGNNFFLSWQTRVCHDKHTFVVTKDVCVFCNKLVFVTNVLSQQKYICHNRTFVATSILLLW